MTTPALPSAPGPRLWFLDWLRILAFFVLIAYHVGMYYVSWDWHVKSPHASSAIEPLMMLSSPWRMSLLFLVSGAAAGCMLAKLAPAAFVRSRSRRLLLPLLFGMLVVVPPQPWLEVVEKLGYDGSYAAFMRLYLSGYNGFCREDCLILPTWNHLWFLPYLWVYTLVLAALAAALGARLDRTAQGAGALLRGWRIVLLPAAMLALARILLVERFEQTHALVDDWYSHATYLPLFLLGAIMARVPRFWQEAEAVRWPSLALALGGWAILMIWWAVPREAVDGTPWALLRKPMLGVYALLAWSAILAACGFARRHLDRDGPARRYLTEAVFPLYILHQTVIVVLAHALKPLRLAPAYEAALLLVLVTVLCFAGFELVRRVAPLRPLFGLAPPRRPVSAAQALAADAA